MTQLVDGKSCVSLFRLCEGLLLLSDLCGRNMFAQFYHTILVSMCGQLGGPRMGWALTAMKKKVEF